LLTVIIATLLLVGCDNNTTPSAIPDLPYADQLRGAVFNPPRPIADFSFASTTGDVFTLSDYSDQIILLYFGYRTCPDVCPTTFGELILLYRNLGEPADQLKIVFVTVDPERDIMEYLTPYVQVFHEDFIGLREEGETLQALMDQFGVIAERQQLGDSPLAYLMDHTASVFLIGPGGQLQVQYLYGTNYRDMAHDIEIILDANEVDSD
jgi:protein SCO1/2